jgi:hypothetical protein
MKSHTRLVLLLAVGLVGGCNSTTERNWAGLDANQRAIMGQASQYFLQQAAKEQAAQNDLIQRNYEAQQDLIQRNYEAEHRKYEDDKIREDMRRCVNNNVAHNPYNRDPAYGCY